MDSDRINKSKSNTLAQISKMNQNKKNKTVILSDKQEFASPSKKTKSVEVEPSKPETPKKKRGLP